MFKWKAAVPVVAVVALAAASHAHDEILAANDGHMHLHMHAHTAPPMYLDQNLPGFPGLGGFPVGLTTPFADEPDEGLFVVPETSHIVFVLTQIDAGMTMYLDGGVPMQVGDAYVLGNPYFHVHPIWSVTNPTAGAAYRFRGFFRDTTGAMADSEEFDVEFVALFNPGCLGDANGDGDINFTDITSILANFGNTHLVGVEAPGDANNNGVVNFSDVTTVLASFGNGCN